MTDLAELQALRAAHQVRELTPDEEGRGVHRLPGGVYGFTYSPGTREMPLFKQRRLYNFEIHKMADGVVTLVGFVTEGDASALEGGEACDLAVQPEPKGDAQRLVAVPYWRVERFREHSIREGGGLQVRLGSAKQN